VPGHPVRHEAILTEFAKEGQPYKYPAVDWKRSPIPDAGFGTFAAEDIPEGEVVSGLPPRDMRGARKAHERVLARLGMLDKRATLPRAGIWPSWLAPEDLFMGEKLSKEGRERLNRALEAGRKTPPPLL